MKVGIDAHSLGSKSSGNETYYRELVKHLSRVDRGVRFVVYYTHAAATDRIPTTANIRAKRVWPRSSYFRISCAFPIELRREKLDIFHAQFIVPPFLTCKTVATIPDIAYEHFPQFFSPLETLRSKILIRRSAQKADHVITVSQYSKIDLVNTYGVDPEKITVTYEGPAEAFMAIDQEKSKEFVERKYSINRPFILYVGRLQARKNLLRLLRAYARLRRDGMQHQLVVVGKRDWEFERIIAEVAAQDVRSSVVFTDYVPGADLPVFYNAADVFVYPSIFEGFGLPVMEAMACGTPVITSLGSSLEEIAGGAAVLIDPYSEASIHDAIGRVVSDPGLRAELRIRGLQRSSNFSYAETARRTIDVYERLIGSA